MTTNEQAIRKSNIAHIKKVMRSAAAKRAGWTGVPMSHFGVLGDEPKVMAAMIADGTLVTSTRERTMLSGEKDTLVFVNVAA